jgi:3-dehydroquinate dehydratase-2
LAVATKTLPVLIVNGPNLNMLGVREPETYGHQTLDDLEKLCRKTAKALGLKVECKQSNVEGELVTWIQNARTKNSAIVINAGAYSHTSVAILDALQAVKLPTVEVHISNIYGREKFRHRSVVSKAANGVICGLGLDGYVYALQAISKLIKS